MKFPRFLLLLSLAALGLATHTVSAQTTPATAVAPVPSFPPLEPIGKITLPGASGRGDYLTVFEGRLYVANTESGTMSVVDLKTNAVVATIADLPRCHGFAGVPGKDVGFVTVGGEDKVAKIDLKNDTVTEKIAVGVGPDAILYTAHSNLIYVACHKGGVATLIDPKRDQVVGMIPLGGTAEFAQEDPKTGLVYQNIEDTNEIVTVDPKRQKVTNRCPLATAKAPTGLAFDQKRGVLFAAASDTGQLLLASVKPVSVNGMLAIGAKVDAVDYDPLLKCVYAASDAGTITVIVEGDANRFTVMGNVTTEPGTHTLAVDSSTSRVYTLNNGVVTIYTPPVLTARYEAPKPPAIPKQLRATTFEAKAIIRVVFHADGTSVAVIVGSSGFSELDKAVLDAVLNAKFKPATMHGKPVDDIHEFNFTFHNKG